MQTSRHLNAPSSGYKRTHKRMHQSSELRWHAFVHSLLSKECLTTKELTSRLLGVVVAHNCHDSNTKYRSCSPSLPECHDNYEGFATHSSVMADVSDSNNLLNCSNLDNDHNKLSSYSPQPTMCTAIKRLPKLFR